MTIGKKDDATGALQGDDVPLAPERASPAWHGEVLAEREAARAAGREVPEDLELVKRRLRADLGSKP